MSFHLMFDHQAITAHTGRLFLSEALGDRVFPDKALPEFGPRDVLFEYIQLPQPAPFATDDPGIVQSNAMETYDLVLFMGQFFTDAYINLGDFPTECPEDYEDMAPYCEFAQSLHHLDKMKFQREGATS